MTAAPTARRITTVSAAALALCLCGAGTAFADSGTLPGVPAPNNVITTLDETLTQATGVDPASIVPTPSPTGTQPPASTPTAPTLAGQQPASTAPRPTAPHATTAPATTTHVTSARAPHRSAPSARTNGAVVPAGMPAVTGADLSFPPATSTAAVAGPAPAVAPLLIPVTTRHLTPAAAALLADKHTGSPVRGILLTLAIGAAVGLGYEHLRLARRALPI